MTTLRIIDANLNRLGEGLRFLEDVARLLLNDSGLTQQLKNMRHELVRADMSLNRSLLQARDSSGDVGANLEEEKQRDLPAAVVANSRRVQESLRVLEELAKLPGSPLEAGKFKSARFSLYTIEKALLAKLTRRNTVARLKGLYVVIDTQALKGRSHVEAARQALRGGARTIQLRDKISGKKELVPIARELKELCAEQNVLFLINDYLDLALAVDADGLHLGQDDLPVAEARRLLPGDKILGASVTTLEEALAAQAEGADYLGVSGIYPTASKEAVQPLGVEMLRRMRAAVSLPLVAIGGINKNNAAEVVAMGADSVAVISAVLGADDIEQAAREIASQFEVKNEPDR